MTHDALAERVFKAGLLVGQIRTRLALPGWVTKGHAAEALLERLG